MTMSRETGSTYLEALVGQTRTTSTKTAHDKEYDKFGGSRFFPRSHDGMRTQNETQICTSRSRPNLQLCDGFVQGRGGFIGEFFAPRHVQLREARALRR